MLPEKSSQQPRSLNEVVRVKSENWKENEEKIESLARDSNSTNIMLFWIYVVKIWFYDSFVWFSFLILHWALLHRIIVQ